jgi:hypothetical protein
MKLRSGLKTGFFSLSSKYVIQMKGDNDWTWHTIASFKDRSDLTDYELNVINHRYPGIPVEDHKFGSYLDSDDSTFYSDY